MKLSCSFTYWFSNDRFDISVSCAEPVSPTGNLVLKTERFNQDVLIEYYIIKTIKFSHTLVVKIAQFDVQVLIKYLKRLTCILDIISYFVI